MDTTRWVFTDRTNGRRIEVTAPSTREERDRLKYALRQFSTASVCRR